jgi:hypothetical protein
MHAETPAISVVVGEADYMSNRMKPRKNFLSPSHLFLEAV